jgi:plasmid replication initiation protein
LLKKNKLKKGQFITGKVFWIWELTKGDDIIVKYEDVLSMVKNEEARENSHNAPDKRVA